MNSLLRVSLYDSISGASISNIYGVILKTIRLDRLNYFDMFFKKCVERILICVDTNVRFLITSSGTLDIIYVTGFVETFTNAADGCKFFIESPKLIRCFGRQLNIIIRNLSTDPMFYQFVTKIIVPIIKYKQLTTKLAKKYIADKLYISFTSILKLDVLYVDKIEFELRDACVSLSESIIILIIDNFSTIPTTLTLFGYPTNELSPLVFQPESLILKDLESKLLYVGGIMN